MFVVHTEKKRGDLLYVHTKGVSEKEPVYMYIQ